MIKKILLLSILGFVFSNCVAQNMEKAIPYLFTIDTENSIYKYIKESKKDSIAFFMESMPNEKYKIHVFLDGIQENYSFSNRKLFINDRFYPLILDTDYFFYVKMENDFPVVSKFEDESERKSNVIRMPDIKEREKNKSLYLRDEKIKLICLSVYWIIDKKGNLIETSIK